MTHFAPMKETEGKFGEEMVSSRMCPACEKHHVIVRMWQSNCGGFEDLQFRCTTDGCGKVWWVDGSDA